MKTKKNYNSKKRTQKSKNRKYTHKKYKKTIKQKGYGKKERERAERERIQMQRDYIRTQQEIKQRFRNTFINLFNRLKSAIESNDVIKINNAVESFQDGFISNRSGINTLIPIANNNLPINKVPSLAGEHILEPDKVIKNLVPLLVIIFENIDDFNIKKQITKCYLQHMGNINLKSTRENITALSSAIKIQDKNLVNFLIDNGADINILSEEQKSMLDDLMRKTVKIKKKKERKPLEDVNVSREEQLDMPPQEDVNVSREEQLDMPPLEDVSVSREETIIPEFHPAKLIISSELPSEYNEDIEPDFWKPIFQENEMTILRQKIMEMINIDVNIPLIKKNPQSSYKEIENIWGVCQINQALIPSYFVQTINEMYSVFDSWLMDTEDDFSNYNIILCAALIVFGVISYKMREQDYEFIIKGGKAIQLVLSNIPQPDIYKTEDIDLLIVPKLGVQRDDLSIKSLAANLACLMKWFLNRTDIKLNISIQSPDSSKPDTNQYIYKLSYLKTITKKFFSKKENKLVETNDYKPFADIDFKNLAEPVGAFFENVVNYPFFIPELNTHVLFTCPDIESIINEKIYFYIKYIGFLEILKTRNPITEIGYTKLDIRECYRILDKFKRSILAINKGILKQLEPLSQSQSDSITIDKLKEQIRLRLTNFGVVTPQMQEIIINSLYSEP
jgi:hypothetical protein